jgi:iron complex transport system permease protein
MRRWSIILLSIVLPAGVAFAQPASDAPQGRPHPRIASCTSALTAIIIQMGLEDHLVAVTRYCDLPPRLQSLPQVADAFNINAEQLLRTNPDLVVTQTSVEKFAALTTIDPYVVVEQIHLERLDDMLGAIAKLGELTGKPEAAQSLLAELNLAIEELHATNPFPENESPRVLFVNGTKTPSTMGRETFIDDIISLAGGYNVGRDMLSQPWDVTHIDAIIDAQPDVIVCFVEDGVDPNWARGYWSRWEDIPASRDGRVFVVSGDWLKLSPSAIDHAREMREMLLHEGEPNAGRWWVMWKVRLSRWLAAAIAGAALAIGGMALQGLLRNPLAEPYLLGVSSGAGVGVLLGMAVTSWFAWAGWYAQPLLAFLGASLTCALVYLLAQRRGRIDPLSLILSGVIINSFNGAVMLVIYLYIDPHRIPDFAQWMMGRIPDMVEALLLIISGSLVVVGWVTMLLAAAMMNVLSLGDSVASSSGVGVHRLRVVTFICVGMMTAAAVALAGPIGFLGLVVPHICRRIVGPDLRKGIIVSGIAGAIVLVGADMLCRLVAPWVGVSLIPVGIVTALTGGPFFIILLNRRRGGVL